MANHTRAWDETTPADTEKAGFGARRMREGEADLRERLAINHNLNVSQTETDNDFDGRHTIVDLTEQVAAPARGISNLSSLYSKNDGTYTELFHENENGDEAQITKEDRVLVGNRHSCFVYLTSDVSGYSGSYVAEKVTWATGTVKYDYGSNFSGGTFTIPVDGIYMIYCNLVGTSCYGLLYLNGSFEVKIQPTYTFGSFVDSFSAGDTLEIYRYSSTAGSLYGRTAHHTASSNWSWASFTLLQEIL
jgi:hypothetical protein